MLVNKDAKDVNNMSNIGMWLLKMLQQQGLSFVLLGVAIWFLMGEVKRWETKYEVCHSMLLELYRNYYAEDKDLLDRIYRKLDEE